MPNKKPTPKTAPKKEQTFKRPTKNIKQDDLPKASPKLASVFELSRDSSKILWQNKKLFSLVILIYGVLYIVLVEGFSSPVSASTIKSATSSLSSGHFSSLFSGVGVFAYLLGSSSSSNQSGSSAYQVVIIIIASLAIIWCLRRLHNGEKIRARDAYYKGLYAFAPYVLVLLFIGLELLPLVFGLGLYSLLIQGGIAVSVIEKIIALIIAIGLSGLTCYLLSSSIMALYIVTLVDMTPLKALRSAKGLVKGQRLLVFRKLIFLPITILIVGAIIMLPFILIIPSIAAWLFLILTMIALAYVHSYCYSLYRGLINE
jgi:hypothetical protein